MTINEPMDTTRLTTNVEARNFRVADDVDEVLNLETTSRFASLKHPAVKDVAKTL